MSYKKTVKMYHDEFEIDGTLFRHAAITHALEVRCTCARTFVVHRSQFHKVIKCYKCGNGDFKVFYDKNGELDIENLKNPRVSFVVESALDLIFRFFNWVFTFKVPKNGN